MACCKTELISGIDPAGCATVATGIYLVVHNFIDLLSASTRTSRLELIVTKAGLVLIPVFVQQHSFAWDCTVVTSRT